MKRMLDQKLINFLISLGDSLKYESSTNTFEIGTNLYVDGKLEINDDVFFKGNLDSYNDSALTFYQRDNAQSTYMSISPLFDETKLAFLYNDGQAIEASIGLDVSVDANILTDKKTKTFFGNQSIVGSGNIDLYVHYLKFSIGEETSFYGVVYSSNNNVTNTLQKLTTLLKPPSSAQMFIPLTNDNNENGVLYWNGSIWQVGYSAGGLNITSVSDRVETI